MSEYTAKNITVLKGLEAVRKRPAMYIGGTDINGLHHLIWEMVDNSIDEALAGYASTISLIINGDGSITVTDNGRGIPTDIHPTEGVSALEITATVLHAGGKFDNDTYKVSSGLHGVGLSVTNALSEWMTIEVFQKGKHFIQEYDRGTPREKVREIGESNKTGTMITFYPDSQIFETIEFDIKRIRNRMRQHAYLNGGIYFNTTDNRNTINDTYSFFFEGGLKSYVHALNSHLKTIHKDIFYVKGLDKEENIEVECSLQYTDDIQPREYAFANNIHNHEGGTHLTGMRLAVTKAVNSYISEFGSEKEKSLKFTGDDIREGLTSTISVKVQEPQFEGQTKIKLNNPEVTHSVRRVVEESLITFFKEHPDAAKSIIGRVILSQKARTAAKAARDAVVRKGGLEGASLPGKLTDCSTKNPSESELFIVEGVSAGGSAKQGRDRRTQAIFALRGKPINPEKYRLDKILANTEMSDLIRALGAGVGETFDISKVRYHKIILMADADVDGAHINTLLLTTFFRLFKPIIESGYLYIAQPPLYKVIFSPSNSVWVQDDQELNKLLGNHKSVKQPLIQRFKGLGEMNADQLGITTMDPNNRILKQVVIEDAEETDRLFDVLMGTEVPPRKKFIQTYSMDAELDI